MKNLLKEASVDEYSKGTKDLHLLILSKCHRVPIDSTIEELRNPSGVLYEEYKKIQELYNEYEEIQKELLKETIK